jgi:hypothetical protein
MAGGTSLETLAEKSPKRKSPPGTTTARQKKKPKAQTKIKVRGRDYTTRKSIIHLVKEDAQRAALKDFKDSHRLYGTVIRGTTNKGYVVAFDIFPSECKTCVVIRKRLMTVADSDKEPEGERRLDGSSSPSAAAGVRRRRDDRSTTTTTNNKPTTSTFKQSEMIFCL